MTHTLRCSAYPGLLLSLVIPPTAVSSQALYLSAGPTVPQAEMAERRGLGGQIAIGLAPKHRARGFTYRLEASRAWFRRSDSYARTAQGAH